MKLVPFGPKKSRFSGQTPSNGPSNGFARIKNIMSRAIQTTGTLIFYKVWPGAGVVADSVLAGVVMAAGVVN